MLVHCDYRRSQSYHYYYYYHYTSHHSYLSLLRKLKDDDDEVSVQSGESDSGDSESGKSDSNKTASYHESEEGLEGRVEKVDGLSRRERQKRAVIEAKTNEKKGELSMICLLILSRYALPYVLNSLIYFDIEHVNSFSSGPVEDDRKGTKNDKRSEREAHQEKKGRIKKKISNDTGATAGRGRVLIEDSDDDVFDTKPGDYSNNDGRYDDDKN